MIKLVFFPHLFIPPITLARVPYWRWSEKERETFNDISDSLAQKSINDLCKLNDVALGNGARTRNSLICEIKLLSSNNGQTHGVYPAIKSKLRNICKELKICADKKNSATQMRRKILEHSKDGWDEIPYIYDGLRHNKLFNKILNNCRNLFEDVMGERKDFHMSPNPIGDILHGRMCSDNSYYRYIATFIKNAIEFVANPSFRQASHIMNLFEFIGFKEWWAKEIGIIPLLVRSRDDAISQIRAELNMHMVPDINDIILQYYDLHGCPECLINSYLIDEMRELAHITGMDSRWNRAIKRMNVLCSKLLIKKHGKFDMYGNIDQISDLRNTQIYMAAANINTSSMSAPFFIPSVAIPYEHRLMPITIDGESDVST